MWLLCICRWHSFRSRIHLHSRNTSYIYKAWNINEAWSINRGGASHLVTCIWCQFANTLSSCYYCWIFDQLLFKLGACLDKTCHDFLFYKLAFVHTSEVNEKARPDFLLWKWYHAPYEVCFDDSLAKVLFHMYEYLHFIKYACHHKASILFCLEYHDLPCKKRKFIYIPEYSMTIYIHLKEMYVLYTYIYPTCAIVISI